MSKRTLRLVGVLLCTVTAGACAGNTATSPSGHENSGTLVDLIVSGSRVVDVGGTTQLGVAAVYSDATSRDVTSQAAWSSETVEIASVDRAGMVTGVKPGEATIRVSFEGKQTGRVVSVQGGLTQGTVKILRLECLGDCEDLTQGAGDFSFLIQLSASAPIETIGGTAGYPSAGAVVRLGAGETFTLNGLKDYSVRDQDGQFFKLEFRATEWDRTILGVDFPDGRMNDLHSAASYQYSGQRNWLPEETNFITLGSGGCRIRLHYQITKGVVPADRGLLR